MNDAKSRRMHHMLWAYLNFYARKLPEQTRQVQCWLYLLEWARLGGRRDEVIGWEDERARGE